MLYTVKDAHDTYRKPSAAHDDRERLVSIVK